MKLQWERFSLVWWDQIQTPSSINVKPAKLVPKECQKEPAPRQSLQAICWFLTLNYRGSTRVVPQAFLLAGAKMGRWRELMINLVPCHVDIGPIEDMPHENKYTPCLSSVTSGISTWFIDKILWGNMSVACADHGECTFSVGICLCFTRHPSYYLRYMPFLWFIQPTTGREYYICREAFNGHRAECIFQCLIILPRPYNAGNETLWETPCLILPPNTPHQALQQCLQPLKTQSPSEHGMDEPVMGQTCSGLGRLQDGRKALNQCQEESRLLLTACFRNSESPDLLNPGYPSLSMFSF